MAHLCANIALLIPPVLVRFWEERVRVRPAACPGDCLLNMGHTWCCCRRPEMAGVAARAGCSGIAGCSAHGPRSGRSTCTPPTLAQAKSYGPIISGALFGAGWWFWVDAVTSSSSKVPFDQVRCLGKAAGRVCPAAAGPRHHPLHLVGGSLRAVHRLPPRSTSRASSPQWP